MVKISFVGDIMCDLHTIRKMERSGNRSFKSFFEPMRDKLVDSDYVVANLETVMAGEDQKFTRDLTSFNTPDAMAEAISTSGISLVTTANNHCLDRGIEGLKRTLDVLDQYGIAHTGTYRNRDEYDSVFQAEIKGLKVAIIACTGSTNRKEVGEHYVDLLNPPDMSYYKGYSVVPQHKGVKGTLGRLLTAEQKFWIKKLLGKTPQPSVDIQYDAERIEP